tara:strand:+ start:1172 stop:2230 length:1059 start_codon:yes stop_codon:yes gene_type:complete
MAYLGQQPITGNFIKLDTISVVNGQAAYTMQYNSANYVPASANHMIVSLNGIIQNPGTSFSVSNHTITFASNLVTGDVINFILVLGDVLNIGTPSDNTVTNDKLATAPTLISKGAGSDSGAIKLNCENNSHGVTIKGPPHSAAQSYTLTLPSTAPAANKMLQSDGSGNLSFVDAPSGGLKFLNRTTISSSTTFVAFDNTYINSTYDDYIIKAARVVPTSDGAYNRWFTSDQNGGNMTQGWYSNGIYQRFDNGSISANGYLANQTYFEIIDGAGTASGESTTYTLYLNNVNNSSQGGTTVQIDSVQHSSNNLYYHHRFSAYLDQGAATNYIRCYFSAGNIASGTFTLYGIVKS